MWTRVWLQAIRRLGRRPGIFLTSVLVLGTGLGLAVFLFSLVQKTILQPLPFPQPDRLVVIGHAQDNGLGIGSLGTDLLLDLHGKLDGVGTVGAYSMSSMVLGGGGHAPAAYEQGASLTASVLHMLDVRPVLGRGFLPADEAPGATPVVLLGASLWRQRYHADPHILGRSLRVDGVWARVVGVLPERFGFPGFARLWLPLDVHASQPMQVVALARLGPGATVAQVRAQLHALQPQLKRLSSGANRARPLTAMPLALAVVHKDTRRWVAMMFLASLLVLLLACVNVSNLQLVQVLNRRHELALRSALGGTRARLMLDALAEGCWIGLGALLVAWPIYLGAGRWLAQVYADNNQGAVSAFVLPHMNAGIAVFLWGTSMLSATLAVLVPVWRMTRDNLQPSLGDGGRGSASGSVRMAGVMVIFEIVLTVLLLVGAGTLIRSMRHILSSPASTRVPATQVLTANLAFPRPTYDDPAKLVDRYRTIARQLRGDAGVVDASAGNAIPGVSDGSDEYIAAQGQPRPPHGWTGASMGIVDTHFLSTYGGRLLQGRFFQDRDRAGSMPVVVIDRTTATRLWPGRDPLGRKLVLHPEAHARVLTVVGVIKPLRMRGSFEPPRSELLLPLQQAAGESAVRYVGLAVHTRAANARAYAMQLQKRVQRMAPQAALYQVFTQARLERMSRVGIWVLVQFFGFLGLVALVLAAAGLYGVLAFTVAQRTREIGIRRAIGAGDASIVRHVSLQLLGQLVLGLAIGLALSWPWTTALAAANIGGFAMRVHDPLVVGLVTAVVVIAVVVATVVPIWRALRVDPAVALRYE